MLDYICFISMCFLKGVVVYVCGLGECTTIAVISELNIGTDTQKIKPI